MATELKVQTFNTYGPLYSKNLGPRTVGLLKSIELERSDIYGFQEVWETDHGLDILEGMKKIQPDLIAVDFDKTSEGRSGLRTFIKGDLLSFKMSNYPVNQDGVLDKVRAFFGIVKSVALSKIKTKEFGTILAVNTHTHPLSQPVRITQMVFLIEEIRAQSEGIDHVFLMGDFNFTPDSLEYRLLVGILGLNDAYYSHHQTYGHACTYCDANEHHWGGPDRVIDYIFFKSLSEKSLRPKTARINLKNFNGRPLSDHYGVRATFEFGPPPSNKTSQEELVAVIQQTKAILVDSDREEEFNPTIHTLSKWLSDME